MLMFITCFIYKVSYIIQIPNNIQYNISSIIVLFGHFIVVLSLLLYMYLFYFIALLFVKNNDDEH